MSILIYFATIFWSLFPNLIHVFQGGDNLINKVNETNLLVNGDFSDETNWKNTGSRLKFTDNTLQVEGIGNSKYIRAEQIYDGSLLNDTIYTFGIFNVIQVVESVALVYSNSTQVSIVSPIVNQEYFISAVNNISSENNTIFQLRTITETIDNIGIITIWKSVGLYNLSTMKANGVKNDSGISFSDLTDQEIRSQLDLWITEYGNLDFKVIYDNTSDQWFDTGFVEKTAERDFLDYLGYFVWLFTPPIILLTTLNLIRRVI